MAMTEAAERVETATVTFAARDSEVDGQKVTQGDVMGLCNGKIKFIGKDVADIAIKTTEKLFRKSEHSLITIIAGEDATEEQTEKIEAALAKKYGSDAEITIVDGGQPIYYYIISVE